MSQICLNAYAKVNLTLDVAGGRADGYHLLQSVMQSIALCDRVHLRKERDIRLRVNHPAVPADARNTAWRAAELFFHSTGTSGGVEIEICKQIPAAAGLGGGSADAAAVLVGLDRLYGTRLSPDELCAMAVQIGADVPFCLIGGTQFAEGIGEELQPLAPVPDAVFVLVKPEEEVSTKLVYENLPQSAFGTRYSRDFSALLEAGASWQELGRSLGNVLETVTARLVPAVEVWKRRLMESGALGSVMSGSGPTVVGVFPTAGAASEFKARWQDQAEIIITHPVGRGIAEVNGGGQ